MSTQEVCLTMDDKHVRRVGRMPTGVDICVCDDARWLAQMTLFRDDVGEITLRLTPDMIQELVEVLTEILDEG